MELRCKSCGSEELVKNGLMRGHQHSLCRGCGLIIRHVLRGKLLAMTAAAVLLSGRGLVISSFRLSLARTVFPNDAS
jgi:uncharacterized Zn finger protein